MSSKQGIAVAFKTVATLLMSLWAATSHAATELYYVHADHLGTPQVMTDKNQDVVWKSSQTPFGETVEESGTLEQPLRFPGQFQDRETGFSYNYYRDYEPGLGRYIQSDPIGLEGGINTYGYGLGNPNRFIDPLGLATLDFFKPGSLGQGAFQNTQAPDGETYVKGHGDRYGVQNDRTGDRVPMTVKELADKLREEGWKEGEPVTLVSCNTRDGDFPQQLADELGVPVTAPDGYVSAQYDGDFWSHHPRFPPVPWGSDFRTWSPR